MGCIQCHFSGEKLQNLGMLTILSQCLRFSGSTYADILIYVTSSVILDLINMYFGSSMTIIY